MGIRHLKLLLVAAMGIAGGVGAGGWWLGYGEERREVREERREPEGSGGELGLAVANPHPQSLSRGERGAGDGADAMAIALARFEGRRWQRGVVDPPTAVVVAPVAAPVPMVQLPPDVQLAGVLVGSAPELGSAFLRIGPGEVETVRVGQGPKARPELVVTEITREGITVRYQGQLLPMKVAEPANPVLRRAE